ncbi:MAG: amidohydrolase family protein [Deltaproteobacteria bacterium]|nr:amidohydrolase family protein [Deltaproteobacteria bacterium]MBW2212097.1 amidohydrolase family protein [Deltaproteobacteria bacterium]MBW2629207.1 amidohydrolase family protein [Deltaproteobacteria bacterium]
MLIVNAEIDGRCGQDVRSLEGIIQEIGPDLPLHPGEDVFDARGGALLPGLNDHHMHLFALAAAESSVRCGPPEVANEEELAAALALPGSGWLRGIGYHPSVAGDLTRDDLDRWVPDRPVRIEHRSGKMWMVNSPAAAQLRLDEEPDIPGIERDAGGRPTGRLFRLGDWIRSRLGTRTFPDLSAVSLRLAGYGVTGVSDANPTIAGDAVHELARNHSAGALLQRVQVMGGLDVRVPAEGLVNLGPVKLHLDEDRLPDFDQLVSKMARAHGNGRPVALHCVTRTELIFALTALQEAGPLPGDRIEHASLTPDASLTLMQQTGVTVVTQPGFVFERGDQYLSDVASEEQPLLYRCRSFLRHGIPLGGSTDTPYGLPDPWGAMRAAVHRRTATGSRLGQDETLSPEEALALFTSPLEAPGAPPRRVEVGAVADLCLLSRRWKEARTRLLASDVAATFRDGQRIFAR